MDRLPIRFAKNKEILDLKVDFNKRKLEFSKETVKNIASGRPLFKNQKIINKTSFFIT